MDYFNHTNKDYVYRFSGAPKQDTIFNEKVLDLFKVSSFLEIQQRRGQKNIASSVQNVFEDKLIQICKEIKILDSLTILYMLAVVL